MKKRYSSHNSIANKNIVAYDAALKYTEQRFYDDCVCDCGEKSCDGCDDCNNGCSCKFCCDCLINLKDVWNEQLHDNQMFADEFICVDCYNIRIDIDELEEVSLETIIDLARQYPNMKAVLAELYNEYWKNSIEIDELDKNMIDKYMILV